MNYKKFIPCIYLYKGNAVKGFDDRTVINMNPGELAKFYSDNNADEIIVFDLSTGDIEHEENLGVIKHMALSVEVPMIGAGNVKRMEDIKKLIYAGCKKATLNLSKESNLEIMKEVSLKFGKDKIVAAFADVKTLIDNKIEIEMYVSELIVINEVELKESLVVTGLPMIPLLSSISLDKMLQILAIDQISGITGELVNENAKEIHSLKKLSKENGIEVNTFEPAKKWSDFKLNSDGMVTVVVQDYKTNEVLMVAYMNEEAYSRTVETGKMTYFSRSRQDLWLKGETSGHY